MNKTLFQFLERERNILINVSYIGIRFNIKIVKKSNVKIVASASNSIP